MKIPLETLWWLCIHPLEGEDYILSVGKDGEVYKDEEHVGKFVMSNILKGSNFGLGEHMNEPESV